MVASFGVGIAINGNHCGPRLVARQQTPANRGACGTSARGGATGKETARASRDGDAAVDVGHDHVLEEGACAKEGRRER